MSLVCWDAAEQQAQDRGNTRIREVRRVEKVRLRSSFMD